MTTNTTRRWRNFDAIRLLAASAVVFSHSFLLSATGYSNEPAVRLLGFRNDLGLLAVGAFFVISGFLITGSFLTRASTTSFFLNRVLRIFPGLIVCTLATTAFFGLWFSAHPLAFLTDGDTWSFIGRTTLLQRNGGVGFPEPLYDGMYGGTVLGTTWTLTGEFQCYLIVLLLGTIGLMRPAVAVALVVAATCFYIQREDILFLEALGATSMFFAAGMALYFLHQRWRPTHLVVALAACCLVVAAALGRPMEGAAIFGSVLLIQLATSSRIRLPDAARFGDLSYGIYLYGFPAQQFVRATWGSSIAWWELFVLSMLLAVCAAWLSWRYVEAPALALARRYRRSVAQPETDAGVSRPASPGDLEPAPAAA